ncbi:MAG: Membrane-bound lytic murein transglycosylase [Pseudomonadota bacterium]
MTATLIWNQLKKAVSTMACDVHEGFVEITRHSLAVIGLAVVTLALTLLARPALQDKASETLLNWLELRQAAQTTPSEPTEFTPASRTISETLQHLNRDQLAVTRWLSSKYKVSPEPLAALVSEAWALGERSQISPTLILAIMAIESRFNPFASGSQGGLGLMQIEPEAHNIDLHPFGGRLAAFDPLTNLRLGTRLLQGLILDANTLEDALRLYSAASGQVNNDVYVDRVLNEQKLLDNISKGAKTASSHQNEPVFTKSHPIPM